MGPFKLCRRVRVRTWIFFRLALMVRGPNSRRLAADWLRRLSENSKAHGFLALRNRPLSVFLLLTPTILLFARPTRQYRQDGEYPYSSIAASSIAPHHRHAHPLAPLLPTGHLLVSTALQDRLRILAPDSVAPAQFRHHAQLPFSASGTASGRSLSNPRPSPHSAHSPANLRITTPTSQQTPCDTRLTHLPPSGPLRRYRNRECQERPRSRLLPPCLFQEHP